MRREYSWHLEKECLLLKSLTELAFRELYYMCDGDVCHDCSFKLRHCHSWREGVAARRPQPGKTNADFSKELGITKRQVAKLRRDANLNAFILKKKKEKSDGN